MLRASKSSDAKPKGKMTAYAFFVQICREEHKKRHPEENVVFTEFSKKCAEKWRSMSEKEKKRFQEMADKDKKRYETEMKDYTPPDNGKVKRGGKRAKRVKDPNAPKRPLSAYFWFSSEERGRVKERNPDFNVAEIAKELGRRWAQVDTSVKAKYEEMAFRDKTRYDREMKEYKKRGSAAAAPLPKKGRVADDEEEEVDDEDEEMDEEEESDG